MWTQGGTVAERHCATSLFLRGLAFTLAGWRCQGLTHADFITNLVLIGLLYFTFIVFLCVPSASFLAICFSLFRSFLYWEIHIHSIISLLFTYFLLQDSCFSFFFFFFNQRMCLFFFHATALDVLTKTFYLMKRLPFQWSLSWILLYYCMVKYTSVCDTIFVFCFIYWRIFFPLSIAALPGFTRKYIVLWNCYSLFCWSVPSTMFTVFL